MTHRTFAQCILGILLAVCFGVYFYAQWDMKRFDASLPEPPPADTAVETPMETAGEDTGDEPPAGHWHGDVWHEEPHTAEPAPPAQPVQPVVAEPQPMKEESPRLAELNRRRAEAEENLKESLARKAERKALKKARDENRISHEEYMRRFGELNARREASVKEKTARAAAERAAEAERAKGGTN